MNIWAYGIIEWNTDVLRTMI